MLRFNQMIDNITKLSKIMTQLIDPIPFDQGDRIFCCYVNASSKIQVARITNIPNWYFERVVFPGQRLLFESLSEAQLEIHTGMMASAILSDTIPCSRLQVTEEFSSMFGQDGQSQSLEEANELPSNERSKFEPHLEMRQERKMQLTV
jgi:hypothetical protein